MNFVFDFGGVLVDWRPAHLIRRVLPARGRDEVSAAQWARRIFQAADGPWSAFDRGLIDADALVPRLAAHAMLSVDEVRSLVEAVPDALQPIAPTLALLDRLRATGRPLYYLSNMPVPYAEQLLRRHAFVGWFADGIFSGHVGMAKPERAIYELAARRFGVAPADLVFLDDHEPNVEAARAAGWRALHFVDAASCEAALRRFGWWPAGLDEVHAAPHRG